MRIHRLIPLAALTAALVVTTDARAVDELIAANEPADTVSAPPVRRAIDLAICLDTSGSMDGLIDATKQKLWAIVNDLALAEPAPDLRVALLTFGNDGHPADKGWVSVDTNLTSDLDLVSERLFALTTNGGTELVGRVLQRAHDDLAWSKDKDALRIAIVAGNESADQDQEVKYADACGALIGRDIVVNSVYCGNPADELAPGWQDVARKADGHFAAIDADNGTVVIETPFDEKLTALSADVNTTYVPFGKDGQRGWLNQKVQDANASDLNKEAAACRAVTKGGSNYRCGWDLVDASAEKDFDLAGVKDDELPEDMRKMTLEERKAHLQKKRKQREAIRKQIAELSTKRTEYVAEAMRKREFDDGSSFDRAVRNAIREQARAKGFRFSK